MAGYGYVYVSNFNESLAPISDVPRSRVSRSHCNISPVHDFSRFMVYHYSPIFLRLGADFECFPPNLESEAYRGIRRIAAGSSPTSGRLMTRKQRVRPPNF